MKWLNHLTESQRAMIAAKLATLKPGDVASQMDGDQIWPPSLKKAADMLNITRSTVVNAKKVLSDGTFEDIIAVIAEKIATTKQGNVEAQRSDAQICATT